MDSVAPTTGSIAFLCAMPMELRPLAKKLSLRRTQRNGLTLHSGSLDGRTVFAAVTGMGTKLATAATERLLDAVAVERVVVLGITGALENSTPIGTLVVPEVVVDSATGVEHHPAPLGAATPRGKMWTTDELITDDGMLESLRAQDVVSLDMETAAIADVCETRGIPWSVFRVVSDRASDGTVDQEVFHLSNQDGTPNVRAILRFVLTHPGRIPAMARLAKGATMAADKAAEAAISACTSA